MRRRLAACPLLFLPVTRPFLHSCIYLASTYSLNPVSGLPPRSPVRVWIGCESSKQVEGAQGILRAQQGTAQLHTHTCVCVYLCMCAHTPEVYRCLPECVQENAGFT